MQRKQIIPPSFMSACGQCFSGGCIPIYIEIIGDAELQCPRVVHDIRRTAHDTGRLYRLRADEIPLVLVEEARSSLSTFLDQYGSETDLVDEICEAFGIAGYETHGIRFFDDEHMRSAIAWLEMMFCQQPPDFTKSLPRTRFPLHEREYLRVTATVLRAIWPQEASTWGMSCSDNDNTPSSNL